MEVQLCVCMQLPLGNTVHGKQGVDYSFRGRSASVREAYVVGADSLVLHHQQLRDGAAADGLPGHHSHACAQERLHQVHA